jgi:hypothetical protein
VELLARGPVHEAFAEPASVRPEPGPIVPSRPREPLEEEPAAEKPEGDKVQWLPGYWAWDEERTDFLWVSGIWRNVPPGRVWVPGRWTPVADGSQWSPGYWAAESQQDTEYLEAPPAPEAAGSTADTAGPGPDYAYAPGYHVWSAGRSVWRPGFWYRCRSGWVYVPPHYVATPAGYVFVGGYWDYPLTKRGLLFAPVAIDFRIWTRAARPYRPSFIVPVERLLGALFVRPGSNRYFFGNYFRPRFRRAGYVAWYDRRTGGRHHDPLFSYYRWTSRDTSWEADLRALYAGRFAGKSTLSPTALVTPLSRVNRARLRLSAVSAAEVRAARRSVEQMHRVGEQRGRFEAARAGLRPGSLGYGLRVLRLDLPRSTPGRTSGRVSPPPIPSPRRPASRPVVEPGRRPTTPLDPRRPSESGTRPPRTVPPPPPPRRPR